MGKGLSDAHPLFWLVDQQVGDEVLGLPRDVLPQLEVEVNVAHLDTLKGLAVVLKKWREIQIKVFYPEISRLKYWPFLRNKDS